MLAPFFLEAAGCTADEKTQLSTTDSPTRLRIIARKSYFSRLTSNLSMQPDRNKEYINILNSLPALIAYVDTNLRYEFVNTAYERWTGASTNAIIGKTVQEMLPQAAYNTIKPYIDQVLAGQSVRFINSMQNSHGLRQLDVSFIPDFHENKSVRGYTVHIIDITDSKRGESDRKDVAEQKSEERFHRMISEVQDYAILLLTRTGIIENWNKGAENIKGYTASEAIGKSFRIFYTHADQEHGLPERLLATAVQNGRAIHEGWRVRKDGSRFWGSVLITALHDNDDNVIGFSKVTRDLTERRNAEEALKQKNIELEKINQELSSFAYVSSHDLQEPLRKIQTFAHRIMEVEESTLSERSREYFKRIQTATTRMRMLIEDLLTYSRTNTEERKVVLTDLNQLVDEVRNELKETIEQKNAVVEYLALPSLRIIPFQFHQLLMNILANALKFSKKDETPHIVIKASTVAGKIVSTAADDAGKVYHHISISDNGIGFSPEYNTRIFEVFQRLHGRNEYEGTGVGLAICRKIVENHGGIITAEGKENGGATFHIYLPA